MVIEGVADRTQPRREDRETLELKRSLQRETLAVLKTFSWFLERYRHLTDPVSYHLARHVYESLEREAQCMDALSVPEIEAYVCRVKTLTCALSDAVREWRSGLIP